MYQGWGRLRDLSQRGRATEAEDQLLLPGYPDQQGLPGEETKLYIQDKLKPRPG